MARSLTARQEAFIDQYVNGPDNVRFNQTQSYVRAYGAEPNSARRAATKLMTNIHIKEAIVKARAAKREKAREVGGINAAWVLEQAVWFYDQCVGLEPIPRTMFENGEPVTHYIHDHNAAAAKGALQLVGQHVAVQAFQENKEVTHVHRLEELLSRRTKVIEGKAAPAEITASQGTQCASEHGSDNKVETVSLPDDQQEPEPAAQSEISDEREVSEK